MPCFSKGCRDAARRSSKPLGRGRDVSTNVPALEWRLVHGQHIAQQLLAQPQAPQLFPKKFWIRKDLLLIIKNKSPETHTYGERPVIMPSLFQTSGQNHQIPLNLARLLVSHTNYRQTNNSQSFPLLTSLSPANGGGDYGEKISEMDDSDSSTAVLFPGTR